MAENEKPGKNQSAQELEDEFSAVLEALGTEGDGSVLVWRYQTSTEPHGYAMVARIAVRDFDPWTVGERFGAGRYRFDVMNSRNRYVKRAIERQILAPPAAPAGAIAAPSALAGIDPVSMLVSRAERADQFNQALMLALIQNLGRTNAAPGGGMSVSDLVAVMREARENATTPAPPHATMLELLREGIGFGRQIEGNGPADDKEDSGGAMALLPKILDVFSRILPPAGAAATATAPAKGGAGSPAATGAGMGDPVKALLAVFAPQIIGAARSGQDPMAFARFVVSATPRGPMLIALRSLVFATGEQRRLAFNAGAPELVPYADWIDRACDAARGFMTARAVPFPRATPAPRPAPPEVSVPVAASATAELEDDDADGNEPDPAIDDDGCDDPECDDPNCADPDHFSGCDDEACDDPECNDPDHFEDDASKEAALRRRERAG